MRRVPLGLIALALAFIVSACSGLAAGSEAEAPPQTGRTAQAPRPTATPEPTKPPLQVADLVGSDGRLTVLLLGSDIREGIIGERTDAIIVATIDPTTGRVAMVSLPRDTVNVQIGPGKTYASRINTLFWDFQRSTGKKKQALKKMKKALGYAFGVEIDYYALADFTAVVRLINSIGGIQVTLDEPLIDKGMHLGDKGLRLKKGERELDGKHALAFTRSRHTSSDYDRSERQQQVLAAATEKVRTRGSDALPALTELVRKQLVTDLPMRAAPALLELARSAKLDNPKSIVLAPGRWARQLPGSYTITPRTVEVRKMFDRVFKAVP